MTAALRRGPLDASAIHGRILASSDFVIVALSESQLERSYNVTLGSQLVFNCEALVN